MKHSPPDRNLALELVRVTEAAAMAGGRWVGRGEKNKADGAAVEAMRAMISTVSMNGIVVIGEGEKDNAPMLFNGEHVGDGTGLEYDVAVDPIDGTTLTAKGMPNASPSWPSPTAAPCMTRPPCSTWTSSQPGRMPPTSSTSGSPSRRTSAESPRRSVRRRPTSRSSCSTGPGTRSSPSDVRATGARIRYITDGDVAGAVMAARPNTGVDLLLGIGGTPEGIIAACAIKCVGGVIQGKLWPKDDEERQKAIDAGHDLDRVLSTEDLVTSDCFFVATGVTDGELLRGVRYGSNSARTNSLVMRSRSGTIRTIESEHNFSRPGWFGSPDMIED